MSTEKEGSINLSWNFNRNRSPGSESTGEAQGLWAFENCAAFPLPMGQVLLKSKQNGNTTVVTAEVFQVLQLCRQFKSLAAHIEAIQGAFPALAERRPETEKILGELARQGFMIPARRLVLNLKRAESVAAPAPFLGVFIRTCERPEQLARLLKSFAENEERHGNRYRYVVMDDSRRTENITENQNLIARFKNENLEIYYYGQEAQRALTSTLTDALPEHKQPIEWLLEGKKEGELFSGGRLWNHMLLLSAGKRLLTIDDDMVCRPYLSPNHNYTFEISDRQRETNFFLGREDLIAQVGLSGVDPIQQHSDVLGRPLAQAINGFSAVEFNEQALRYLNSSEVGALHAGSPLSLTQSGIFGDPGTVTTSWIYELEGEARSQLVESHDAYIKRRASRHLWLGASNFRFNSRSSLVSTLTGIDNSGLLPPSIPYFRNEDDLFGTLVKFIVPDSLVFEFPWGLLHLPEPERSWSEQELDKPASVGLLAFLADVANNSAKQCYAIEPARRMAFLAEVYLALADAPDSILGAGIEENLTQARTKKANLLHACLDKYGNQPQYWTSDIRRLLQANSRALMDREPTLLPDDPSCRERAQQIGLAKEVLMQFGKALQVWPLLWEHGEKHLDKYFSR